jgi:ribosomal protein L16/L10AE
LTRKRLTAAEISIGRLPLEIHSVAGEEGNKAAARAFKLALEKLCQKRCSEKEEFGNREIIIYLFHHQNEERKGM